jgi:hypothetical protein
MEASSRLDGARAPVSSSSKNTPVTSQLDINRPRLPTEPLDVLRARDSRWTDLFKALEKEDVTIDRNTEIYSSYKPQLMERFIELAKSVLPVIGGVLLGAGVAGVVAFTLATPAGWALLAVGIVGFLTVAALLARARDNDERISILGHAALGTFAGAAGFVGAAALSGSLFLAPLSSSVASIFSSGGGAAAVSSAEGTAIAVSAMLGFSVLVMGAILLGALACDL